ncbi:MAG: TRAP transporter substrate-binding protein [Treponema sp.]|nr:TRAP transporter substrate-binding protein [Treponema sp.]
MFGTSIRKTALAFIAAAAPFIAGGCNEKNEIDKPITLVMAEVNPEDSITGQFSTAFKKKVEELSKGTITIDLQYKGILGDESQIMKLIVSPDSSIHLARVSASLASYGGKKSKLITIPYTFSSAEHFWKFAESEIAEEILNEPYENGLGVKGICYGEEGFRNFFATTPLNSLEDMKGLRVRVSNSKTMKDLVKALGAEPVEVNFTDLYAKMLIGETNAAEQPIANYKSNEFHKVAPYMIKDGHNLGAIQILINAVAWDSLSPGQQSILKSAGKYATEECKRLAKESEAVVVAQLEKEGATIVDIADKKEWQNACKSVIEESSKEFPELYKKILELK